jgi:solute carrier family 35 protein E3
MGTPTAALVAGNFLSSVAIIALNKHLISSSGGASFVLFLTALHFIAGYLMLSMASQPKGAPLGSFALFARPQGLPRGAVLTLAAAGAVSICVTNVSLKLNSMGTYQILKVAVLPASMLLTWAQRVGPPPSAREAAAAGLVVIGTLLCTASDVWVTAPGLLLGCAGVLLTAQYQILQGGVQRAHGVSGAQALFAASLAQGLMTLAASAVLEVDWAARWGTAGGDRASLRGGGKPAPDDDVVAYLLRLHGGDAAMLAATCVAAVALNYTSIALLGRWSAVTMQFVNQGKTAAILALDFVLFRPPPPPGRAAALACGVACVFAGVAWYSRLRVAPAKTGGGAGTAAAAAAAVVHQRSR